MSEREPGDRLDQALGSLPRVAASEGFTPRLVARLERRAARPRRRPRRLWAAAAVLVAIALSVAFGLRRQQLAEREYAERVERLRRETHRLSEEFTALRAQAAGAAPVLYLAGDDRVELVLDLGPPPPGAGAPANRPARWDDGARP